MTGKHGATGIYGAVVGAAVIGAALTGLAAPLGAQDVKEHALAGPEATFPEGFSRLSGMRELADGRVMVADGLGQVLVIADLASGVADTIGAEGQGPDEYREPDGLFVLPGDSTLLVDLGNGRLTAIAPDGSFGETTPIAQPAERGLTLVLPRATDSGGGIYFQQMGGMAAARGLPDSAAVVRFDRGSGAYDTLALVKMPETKVSESGGGSERNVMMRPAPLSDEDAWGVGLDGRVAVARAGTKQGEYWIEWVLPDGQAVSGTPTKYRPVKVGAGEKQEWVRNLGSDGLRVMITNENGSMQANMSRGGGGRGLPDVDGFDWPDAMPAFTSNAVQVDPNGYAWVVRETAAGEAPLVDVFGPDGTLKAHVRLPRACEIAGFGTDAVYLVRTDDLDFQWLERYEPPTL